MKTLYETIAAGAEKICPLGDTVFVWRDPEIWNKWCDAWFIAAEDLRREMVAQGLLETASAVAKIIAEQRKFYPEAI